MTSRSEPLLQMLKPASPVAKVLLLSLQSHAHLYRDSGLFAALLSVESVITQLTPAFIILILFYTKRHYPIGATGSYSKFHATCLQDP